MIVQNIPVEKLKPYLRNAKKHPPEQIRQLATKCQNRQLPQGSECLPEIRHRRRSFS